MMSLGKAHDPCKTVTPVAHVMATKLQSVNNPTNDRLIDERDTFAVVVAHTISKFGPYARHKKALSSRINGQS
jgi:hypothetical protein